MKLASIFDVFSKRNSEMVAPSTELTVEFRRKIIMFCQDVFSNETSWPGGRDYTGQFWDEIHQALRLRHGKFQLSDRARGHSPTEDLITYLLECPDEEFLDFLEYIFKVDSFGRIQSDANEVVSQINVLLASDGLPFELTDKVTERTIEPVNEYPFFGREMEVEKTLAYPRVISKENLVTHASMLGPVLTLLADPRFRAANSEYREALERFRKSDYGNCLVHCGSAFESVMKVICHEKGWAYSQQDSASKLLKTIIPRTNLGGYFEQPLIIVATLRNRLSKAHGAGTATKAVPRHVARYALNATAAAIILLTDEVK
jgi:hypothetical protein